MSKRVLLDTNIIVHRERGDKIYIEEIGTLFYWLDKLHYEKCIHPQTIAEISKHQNQDVVTMMQAKLKSYNVLKTVSKDTPAIQSLRTKHDRKPNDDVDISLLSEIHNKRVDYFITEDRGIHKKAAGINVADRVFTVDSFLEKCVSENPDLTDYKVLAVKRVHFGDIDLADPFFDSFKQDYAEFEDWFNRKSDNPAYICTGSEGLLAFLYVKPEGEQELYNDISPVFQPANRLKIGTFKVTLNGFKLGERFLKIVFDNALKQKVDEIYVTIFEKRPEQQMLIKLLEDWGFNFHGTKTTKNGTEKVYLRNFRPHYVSIDPQKSYPFVSMQQDVYFVPIYPSYHTDLLPDSYLKTESPDNFVENRPYRNAIRKVYISRSVERGMKKGDIVVFYRTKDVNAAHYSAVATTIGIIDDVVFDIKDEEQFIGLCRKRSVFSDEKLKEHWNYNPRNRPFIVNFLYVYSLPTPKLTLAQLKEYGIIAAAPRGFEKISRDAFKTLLQKSNAEKNFIVD